MRIGLQALIIPRFKGLGSGLSTEMVIALSQLSRAVEASKVSAQG